MIELMGVLYAAGAALLALLVIAAVLAASFAVLAFFAVKFPSVVAGGIMLCVAACIAFLIVVLGTAMWIVKLSAVLSVAAWASSLSALKWEWRCPANTAWFDAMFYILALTWTTAALCFWIWLGNTIILWVFQ